MVSDYDAGGHEARHDGPTSSPFMVVEAPCTWCHCRPHDRVLEIRHLLRVGFDEERAPWLAGVALRRCDYVPSIWIRNDAHDDEGRRESLVLTINETFSPVKFLTNCIAGVKR